MHFLVIGYDGTDEGALDRRLAARQAHLDLSAAAAKTGQKLLGGAFLNDQGNMCGSAAIFDFPDREAVEEFLKDEPYINGKVWERVEIYPFNVAPSFKHLFEK